MSGGAARELEFDQFQHPARQVILSITRRERFGRGVLGMYTMERGNNLAFFTVLVAINPGAGFAARHALIVMHKDVAAAQDDVLQFDVLRELDHRALTLGRNCLSAGSSRAAEPGASQDKHCRNQPFHDFLLVGMPLGWRKMNSGKHRNRAVNCAIAEGVPIARRVVRALKFSDCDFLRGALALNSCDGAKFPGWLGGRNRGWTAGRQ
jgi:hypothetical protein